MKNTRNREVRAQRDSKPLGQLPAGAQTDSQVSPPDKPPVPVASDGSVLWGKGLTGKELTTELQANLPTDNTATVKRFQTEFERFGALGKFFEEYPADKEGLEEAFGKSERALNYKRPYDVSLVGLTGSGKSALTNLLLGRNLSLSRPGTPVTGTLLRFQHNVPPGEDEKAVVSYRDRNNLFSLIQREFERFGLTPPLKSPDDVKVGVADTLNEIQLPANASEDQKQRFGLSREAIVKVFQLFFEHLESLEHCKFTSEFTVSSAKQIKALNDHLSQVSGVIKEVNYSLKPRIDSASLKLPTNVCLVDLPGEFGAGAHEFVIDDSIPDAGAVIFLTRSPRTGTDGEVRLAERVRNCLNVPGRLDSSEKVFLLLNFNEDQAREDLMEGLKRTIEELSLKRKPIEISLKPGEEKRVPELIAELNTFTGETLLEERIADGQSAINSIVAKLKRQYTADLNRLSSALPEGENAEKRAAVRLLDAREESAKELLSHFRLGLLDAEEDFRTDLKQEGDSICQKIDKLILKAVQANWKSPFTENRLTGQTFTDVSPVSVVTAVGAEIWKALPGLFGFFADILTEQYREKFSDARMRQKLIESHVRDVPQEKQELFKFLTEEFFTEESISGIIDEMSTDLVKFGERIGLVFLTKPEYSFNPKVASSDEASSDSDEASSDSGIDDEAQKAVEAYAKRSRQQSSASSENSGRPGGSAPSQNRPTVETLMAALPSWETSVVEEADFDNFVHLARERYQNAVLVETVEAFLDVFKYQWLKAQERLESCLEDARIKLVELCSTNPELRLAIIESGKPESAEAIKKAGELGAKIRQLEEI